MVFTLPDTEQVVRIPNTPLSNCCCFADLEYTGVPIANREQGLPKTFRGWTLSIYTFVFVFVLLTGLTGCVSVFALGLREYILNTAEKILVVLCILLFLYLEGYLGFHRNWAQIVVRRCLLIGHIVTEEEMARSVFLIVFAPLFAVGLFWAPKRRLYISYTVLAALIVLALIIGALPMFWAELVASGLAVGLLIGTFRFLFFYIAAVMKKELPDDCDYRTLNEENTNNDALLH